ncbi:hypothetical protein Scep_023470 [Stephania cephalantha]|uniref:Glycoside hydrolase family 31 TIM barrel domain-containing protein n=1 Tax=Stephania cephalantha TaxID=152367 RepID=A0AAP0EXH4_9MAGN
MVVHSPSSICRRVEYTVVMFRKGSWIHFVLFRMGKGNARLPGHFERREYLVMSCGWTLISMDGFRCFTFDKDRFPNPKALVNELHLNGFKAIWMLDPGIKHEEGYFVYDSGSKGDVWIQNVDGKPFVVDIPFNT